MANLSNLNNKFLVTTGGNVGIGATAPVTKLDITGTANGDTIRVANTGTYGGTISFNQGTGNTNIGYVGSLRALEGNPTGDNGIGLYSRNRISFYTNSTTPDLTIKDAGNVGIGTTTPSQKLEVSGNIRIGTSATANYIQYIRPGGAIVGGMGWHTDDMFYVAGHPSLGPGAGNDVRVWGFGQTLRLGTNTAGDRITIINTGKVGIGSHTPSTALHLDQPSNDRAGGLYIERNGSNYGLAAFVDSGGYGIIGSNGNYTNDIIQMNLSNSNVVFSGNGTFDTVLNVIAPDGGGSPAMTSIINMHGYDQRGVGIKMKDNVTTSGGGTDAEWFIGTGYNTTGFNIGYASNGSQTSYPAQTKFFIYPGGNIRMGDTNMTDARFTIIGANSGTNPAATAHMASALILYNAQGSDGSFSGIDFHNSSNLVDSRIVGVHTSHSSRHGELAFLTHNGSVLAEKMRISKDGYVGIGGSAQVKLEVFNGSLRVRGSSANNIELSNTSGNTRATLGQAGNEGDLSLYRSNNSKYVYLSSYYNCYIDPQQASAVVGIGGAGTGIANSGQGGNTTLDVQGPVRNKRVMRGWYLCGPITSTNAYRHIKTNLWMGGSPAGNTEYIMGGFEAKGYAYGGTHLGFGHGTCMFHNWSGAFYSLDVRNFGKAGFMQSPYVSSDGYCVIVLRQNTYCQPVIDFCQYYTPYPWRSSYVTAETTSNNLTGVY